METDEVYAQMTLQPLTPVVSQDITIIGLVFIFDGWLTYSEYSCNSITNIFVSHSKSKRIHFFLLSWEFQANSQLIIFARH